MLLEYLGEIAVIAKSQGESDLLERQIILQDQILCDEHFSLVCVFDYRLSRFPLEDMRHVFPREVNVLGNFCQRDGGGQGAIDVLDDGRDRLVVAFHGQGILHLKKNIVGVLTNGVVEVLVLKLNTAHHPHMVQ